MEKNSYLKPYTEEGGKKIQEDDRAAIKLEKSAHHYGAYLIVLLIVEYAYSSFPFANFISSPLGRMLVAGVGLAIALVIPGVFIFWIVDLIRCAVEKRKNKLLL
jgi:hypothetical protein